MTTAQKQSLINAAAKAAKAFSDMYDSVEPSEPGFYTAWEKVYGGYQESVAVCPSCDTGDPGNPPPP